jgi:predicted HTH domain antitoxin
MASPRPLFGEDQDGAAYMEMKFEISIPEKIVKVLGYRKEGMSDALKRDLAAYFFEKGMLGFGQARQFSGLSVWDFLDLLRERKIPLHYDLSEYEEDSETVRKLTAG